MSLVGVTIPPSSASSAHQSGTPSPTLSSKPLAGRSLTSVQSLSRPISPVINAAGSSIVIVSPPTNVAVQRQTRPSNHVRSHSVPSLQRQLPQSVENLATPINLVRNDPHSSSAVNLLTPRRESMLRTQSYTSYFPNSPQLKPLMSPGPVTPMQLEEDLECRFPNVGNHVRHSPLIVPVLLDGEESETEACLEMPQRRH
jgi:hypothetical protein